MLSPLRYQRGDTNLHCPYQTVSNNVLEKSDYIYYSVTGMSLGADACTKYYIWPIWVFNLNRGTLTLRMATLSLMVSLPCTTMQMFFVLTSGTPHLVKLYRYTRFCTSYPRV